MPPFESTGKWCSMYVLCIRRKRNFYIGYYCLFLRYFFSNVYFCFRLSTNGSVNILLALSALTCTTWTTCSFFCVDMEKKVGILHLSLTKRAYHFIVKCDIQCGVSLLSLKVKTQMLKFIRSFNFPTTIMCSMDGVTFKG